MEFPQPDVPPTVFEETNTNESPLADYPPSPMVSSEGKTILAAALAESAEEHNESSTKGEQSKSDANQSPQKAKTANGSVPQIDLPPLEVKVNSSPIQSEIVRPLSPGQGSSPNTRRKFTIRRVIEPKKNAIHSTSSAENASAASQSSPQKSSPKTLSPNHASSSDSAIGITDNNAESIKHQTSSAIHSEESSKPDVKTSVSSESDSSNAIVSNGQSEVKFYPCTS